LKNKNKPGHNTIASYVYTLIGHEHFQTKAHSILRVCQPITGNNRTPTDTDTLLLKCIVFINPEMEEKSMVFISCLYGSFLYRFQIVVKMSNKSLITLASG